MKKTSFGYKENGVRKYRITLDFISTVGGVYFEKTEEQKLTSNLVDAITDGTVTIIKLDPRTGKPQKEKKTRHVRNT